MARISIAECTEKVGETVELAGWVDTRRDHGKLIFIDLRDESGLLQIVFTPGNANLHKEANHLRPEWVIRVIGLVKERPKGMQNLNIPTGTVEMEVSKLEVLNEAETPPFELSGDGYDINEETRFEYRYLDLRRPRLQKNLRLRSEFIRNIREYLFKKNFIEIETPLLTKSTPEGSRDFLVPSRMQSGKFYALPQSPQQYKQLLMVAGFEKYFQIARALRDEDLRADRSFEHTQIDLEMSFVNREDVMGLIENMYTAVCELLGYTIYKKPFPVFSYEEALKHFAADKFDMRPPKEQKHNTLAFAWVVDFPLFEKTNTGAWTYSHNPFTGPRPLDEEKLRDKKDIGNIMSLQYDLVCNGHEVGGGGIRIRNAELLQKVFEIIGHTPETIERDFGHMLKAFRYGAPLEGGIALGIDRIIAILAGETSVREVQAFPMTAGGRTSAMDAPSEVSKEQLAELGLLVKKQKKHDL